MQAAEDRIAELEARVRDLEGEGHVQRELKAIRRELTASQAAVQVISPAPKSRSTQQLQRREEKANLEARIVSRGGRDLRKLAKELDELSMNVHSPGVAGQTMETRRELSFYHTQRASMPDVGTPTPAHPVRAAQSMAQVDPTGRETSPYTKPMRSPRSFRFTKASYADLKAAAPSGH